MNHSEPLGAPASDLLASFLDHRRAYSRDFSEKLATIGRSTDQDWEIRRLAALMLQHQFLCIPESEIGLAHEFLGLLGPLKRIDGDLREFRQRLARLDRVFFADPAGAALEEGRPRLRRGIAGRVQTRARPIPVRAGRRGPSGPKRGPHEPRRGGPVFPSLRGGRGPSASRWAARFRGRRDLGSGVGLADLLGRRVDQFADQRPGGGASRDGRAGGQAARERPGDRDQADGSSRRSADLDRPRSRREAGAVLAPTQRRQLDRATSGRGGERRASRENLSTGAWHPGADIDHGRHHLRRDDPDRGRPGRTVARLLLRPQDRRRRPSRSPSPLDPVRRGVRPRARPGPVGPHQRLGAGPRILAVRHAPPSRSSSGQPRSASTSWPAISHPTARPTTSAATRKSRAIATRPAASPTNCSRRCSATSGSPPVAIDRTNRISMRASPRRATGGGPSRFTPR